MGKLRFLIGGKGGGGGSTFRNRPDNLRSTDTFETLLGLVTGRIRGLAPGGLKNYFINDVPVEDGSGNKTLDDFSIFLYNGDPAQLAPVTLQLGGSAGTDSVNLAVDNANASAIDTSGPAGDWRFGAVTTPGVDYIDLRFLISQLFKQDADGINDATASLEIQLQPSGSSEWINPLLSVTAPAYNEDGYTVDTGLAHTLQAYLMNERWEPGFDEWHDAAPGFLQVTGKTTQAYIKELRIAVPNTGAYDNVTWSVRVRLMERDSFVDADNEERRTILWESIAGVSADILGDSEEWRGLAYIQINGKASDQLNGVPTLEGIFDLAEVKVPPASVWDAETRVYTVATWDGTTEEIRWTQCPAFQLKDLIEDDISGLSALIPGSTLNKWDALEASKWYSELVSDGAAGQHPRYSMNYLLDSPMGIEELIQYVAGATGSYAWDRGDGQWRLVVDKPENPVALFTKENIVGEFNYSHTDIDTRFNEIIGVFRNEAQGFVEDRVRVFDQPHIDIYGKRSTSLALVGCTHRQEALRRVKIRQLSSLYETKQVTFVTNRQGTLIQPFNVIMIADSDLGNSDEKTTGRLTSISGTTLRVRDTIRLELGVDYVIHVTIPNPEYDPDMTTQPTDPDWNKPTVTITRDITNTAPQRGDVRALYIDTALPADTPINAPIAFEAVGLPALPKQFRVIAIEPDESNDELATVVATEIYTAKWDESDAVDESAILGQEPKTVPSPTNMTIVIDTFDAAYQAKRVISVQWQRPTTFWFQGFKVEYRFNGGPPIILDANTQNSFIELQEPQDGLYEFSVYTLDRRGGISLPLTDSVLLGAVGPAGTFRVSLSDTAVNFKVGADGQILAGYLPYAGWAKFYVGDVEVTSVATWAIDPTGSTATIDIDGTWEITAVTASGRLIITGEYQGQQVSQTINISKIDSTAGVVEGGSIVTITSFPSVSSTSYPSDPYPLDIVNSGGTGAITFDITIVYYHATLFTMAAKIVYRPTAGGAWTDVASETVGDLAILGEYGSVVIAPTEVTGLTASTNYDFGVLFRRYAGAGSSTPEGFARAEGNT